MASTEKELELEGHTLPTGELLAEAARISELGRTHLQVLRTEGVEPKNLTEIDQVRDLLTKEHARVEMKPIKVPVLSRDMEKVVDRAYTWRTQMVRRADRAYADDRLLRLRFHRHYDLLRLPERLYEEIHLLLALAKHDVKRLQPLGVSDAFLEQGEDLLYELHGHPPPDRAAKAEYEKKKREHRFGPPPTPPPEPPRLPDVVDYARGLSALKGRLYLILRDISAAGQLAFCHGKEKDTPKGELLRREFVLRLRPSEDPDDLLTFGRPSKVAEAQLPSSPLAAMKQQQAQAQPAAPAAPAKPSVIPSPRGPNEQGPRPAAERSVLPMEQVTSKPGGPNPAPPSDPFKKPPPRAVGLVRPSATQGTKTER